MEGIDPGTGQELKAAWREFGRLDEMVQDGSAGVVFVKEHRERSQWQRGTAWDCWRAMVGLTGRVRIQVELVAGRWRSGKPGRDILQVRTLFLVNVKEH